MKRVPNSIYVHLPFCHKKCNYCTFPIHAIGKSQQNMISFNEKTQNQYTEYLLKEIQTTLNRLFQRSHIDKKPVLDTLYFGGGTPSLISEANLQKIFELLKNYYVFPGDNHNHCENYKDLKNKKEISFEVDPGTFDLNKLKFYENLGINRLSLGIQSFNEEELKQLNRSHNLEDIYKSLDLISQTNSYGDFQNVSLDLIINTPYQEAQIADLSKFQNEQQQLDHNKIFEEMQKNDQKKDNGTLKHNLEELVKISPGHASIYSLMIEKESIFARKYHFKEGKYPLPDDDKSVQNYLYTHNFLQQYGYNHYEVSSYNKLIKDKEEYVTFDENYNQSKHNKMYWEGVTQFLGFGMGAASLVDCRRFTRPKNLKKYYEFVDDLERNISHMESLQGELEIDESQYTCLLMGSLRSKEGLNMNKIIDLYGLQAAELTKKYFQQLYQQNQKLFYQERLGQNQIRLSMTQGVFVADEIIYQLIDYLTTNNAFLR